jgi:hypothetical protein
MRQSITGAMMKGRSESLQVRVQKAPQKITTDSITHHGMRRGKAVRVNGKNWNSTVVSHLQNVTGFLCNSHVTVPSSSELFIL